MLYGVIAKIENKIIDFLPLSNSLYLEVSFRVTDTAPGQQIRHWPSLDLLISVTYKIEDCLACLRYIEWALKVCI